jgi:hypothetical protein
VKMKVSLRRVSNTRLHGITSQKIFIVIAVRTSNIAEAKLFVHGHVQCEILYPYVKISFSIINACSYLYSAELSYACSLEIATSFLN